MKVTHKGHTYTFCKGYFRKTTGNREPLHRVLWRESFGPIRKGMDVFFVDGNPKNMTLGNLGLKEKGRIPREPKKMFCKNCEGEIEYNSRKGHKEHEKRDFCSNACKHEFKIGRPRGGAAIFK